MCKVANVSRCGYYKWLKNQTKAPKDYDDYLLIKEVFDKGRKKLGWRSIKMKLERNENIIMNHKKIIRIKNQYNLITKIRRRNPYREMITKTKEHRVLKNIVNREFNNKKPGEIFCTDITYLPFLDKIGYLSVIKDIATKEIVAWNLTNNLKINLVLETINKIKDNKGVKLRNTIIHSDQGFHYTSPVFISEVKKLRMVQSMSRKGNCLDNAPIESFFGHFKDEVDYKQCKTLEELRMLTDEYIKYYNNERYQWNLNKMTPVEYREFLLKIQ